MVCALQAIEAANASGPSKNGAVGIGINWARSVLEVRNVANAVTHIEAAKAKGVLSGIIFSGCEFCPPASQLRPRDARGGTGLHGSG